MKKFFLLFFILILIFIGFLPMILSTPAGNRLLITFVEMRYGGDLEAESIHLSWLGPQEAKKIDYKTSEMEASADAVNYSGSLFSLAQKKLAQANIKNGKVVLTEDIAFTDIQLQYSEGQIEAEGKTKSEAGSGNFTISGGLKNEINIELKAIPLAPGSSLGKALYANLQGNLTTGTAQGNLNTNRLKIPNLSLKLEKKTLHISIPTLKYDDYQLTNLAGTLAGKNLQLNANYKESQVAANTQLKIAKGDLSFTKPIQISFTNLPIPGKIEAQIKPFTYSFDDESVDNLQGKLTYLKSSATLRYKAPKLELSAQLKEFPTSLFSYLLPANSGPSIFGILGTTIDGTLSSKLENKNGPVDLKLTSDSFNGTISGQIEKTVFTLREAISAKLSLSESMRKTILANFDVNLIKTSQPLELSISKENFSLPILPLDLTKFNAGYGRLDLGQFDIGNTQTIDNINKLLNLTSESSTHIWFAPAEFEIKKGIIKLERTDFLYQKTLQFALWGRANLPNCNVNMTLGITAEALTKTLGISNLSETYVLQIPYRGTFGKVRLDTSSAAKQIALLIARKEALPRIGGTWGQIFSGLTDVAEPSSPPPKRPFPWE